MWFFTHQHIHLNASFFGVLVAFPAALVEIGSQSGRCPVGPSQDRSPNPASFPVKVAISITAFGPSFGPQRAKGQRGKGARGYPAMTRILRPDGNKWWSLGNWVAGICGFLWAGPYLHAGNRCGRPRRLTFDHQNSITVLGTCSRLTLLNFLLSIRNSGTK